MLDTGMISAATGAIGHIGEWHLIPAKAFDHLEFG
jgi:hypothetical protein